MPKGVGYSGTSGGGRKRIKKSTKAKNSPKPKMKKAKKFGKK